MTTDRELMQQVLDVLTDAKGYIYHNVLDGEIQYDKAINALKARLAQPEQEPVAYLYKNIEDYEKHVGFECNDAFIVGWNMARTTERMLSNYFYTAPPQREWKGLTDEEYKAIRYGHDENGEPNVEYELFDEGEYGMEVNIYVDDFYRAIEAKLKEKNNA